MLAEELDSPEPSVVVAKQHALSLLLDIDEATSKHAIADLVPARYRDVHLQAFDSGRAADA